MAPRFSPYAIGKTELTFSEMGRVYWNMEERSWVSFGHVKFEIYVRILSGYFESKLDIQFYNSQEWSGLKILIYEISAYRWQFKQPKIFREDGETMKLQDLAQGITSLCPMSRISYGRLDIEIRQRSVVFCQPELKKKRQTLLRKEGVTED